MTHRYTKVAGTAPQGIITLAEAKDHLRVTVDDEDEILLTYIMAATDWAEQATRRAIQKRQYLIVNDAFPSQVWRLPLGKIQSVDSIQYIDADGVTQSWSASPPEYALDNDSDHAARLRPKSGFSWPTTGSYDSAARVTVTAGWTSAEVPYSVKQAILIKLAVLYEARGPGDPEAEASDYAAQMLLSGWALPVFA